MNLRKLTATILVKSKTNDKQKADRITKAICNKGFSGTLSILFRSNFGVSGQECSPQSLTAYSLSRYAAA
jgi:hypothetical protein